MNNQWIKQETKDEIKKKKKLKQTICNLHIWQEFNIENI